MPPGARGISDTPREGFCLFGKSSGSLRYEDNLQAYTSQCDGSGICERYAQRRCGYPGGKRIEFSGPWSADTRTQLGEYTYGGKKLYRLRLVAYAFSGLGDTCNGA